MITVIMSVYNEEPEVLLKAINSILSQTYTNLEFIIVNDNPKDENMYIFLKKIAQRDKRIILIINENNIGLAKSLNRAIDMARGDFIVRMDADDISCNTRLETQYKKMVNSEIDILGTHVTYIDELDNRVGSGSSQPCESYVVRKVLKYRNCVMHPTWMVKREVYTKLGGYRDILACEDYDLLLRAVSQDLKIANCQENLLLYRIRTTSISNVHKFEQIVTCLFLQRNVKALYELTCEEIANNIKMITEDENEKKLFVKANEYHEKAITAKRQKKFLLTIINTLRAVLCSRYFRRFYLRHLYSKIILLCYER